MNKSDIRICFVGDSFVNGACDPDCLGWAGRVCSTAIRDGYQVTHYNLGIRRNTSADIAARWCVECQSRLTPEYDSRVVFSFGANDTVIESGKQRLNSETTLRHAKEILSQAKGDYSCLWIGPPPVADARHNERMEVLCKQFQSLSVELSVPYLPVLSPLLKSDAWMSEVISGDGAHPQSGGYSVLAHLIEAWPSWWFKA